MDEPLAPELARIAAAFYGAFLDEEIPQHQVEGPLHFTPGQAFELTRVVLFEALKDQGLV